MPIYREINALFVIAKARVLEHRKRDVNAMRLGAVTAMRLCAVTAMRLCAGMFLGGWNYLLKVGTPMMMIGKRCCAAISSGTGKVIKAI